MPMLRGQASQEEKFREATLDSIAADVGIDKDRAQTVSPAAVNQAVQGMSRAFPGIVFHPFQPGADQALAQKPQPVHALI